MSATVLLRRSLTARNVARLGQLCQTSACFSTAAVKSSLADGDLRDFRGRFDLTKKNFVVTGGGRGIGYAITRTIAEMGGNVCVMDMLPRPVKDFEKLSAEFGVRTKYLSVDVTDEKGLTQAFEQTVTDFKTLDGCVTAAGIGAPEPFIDQTWQGLRRVLDVNVVGTYFSCQLAAKQMLQQGTAGSMVLIASISGQEATPGFQLSAYNASKGAVRMLTTALSTELGPHQIRVNSISPGCIDTDLLAAFKENGRHLVEMMNKTPALKRIGNRNDLTPAVIYLLSEASAWTTGAELMITGGLHGGRIDYP